MYYLNSRYYNPEIGRFINADGLLGKQGDILGHNLYAYCQNNPVMYYDPSGYSLVGVLGGLKIAAIVSAVAPFVLPALAIVATVALVTYVVVNYDEIEAGFKNKIDSMQSNSLDLEGPPNSIGVLRNPDGSLKQKRWYDEEGKVKRDRDYDHPGKMKFPHDHEWEKDGDGKLKRGTDHLDPDYDNYPEDYDKYPLR